MAIPFIYLHKLGTGDQESVRLTLINLDRLHRGYRRSLRMSMMTGPRRLSKMSIYLIGVVILGLSYPFLKSQISDPLIFLIGVVWVIACRRVAETYGRRG